MVASDVISTLTAALQEAAAMLARLAVSKQERCVVFRRGHHHGTWIGNPENRPVLITHSFRSVPGWSALADKVAGEFQRRGLASLLLASRRLPGERLCERDREAIGIDADRQPDALVCLLSRCADKLRASCHQFPIRGCEIFNREAD
jgi:hypothetical protein